MSVKQDLGWMGLVGSALLLLGCPSDSEGTIEQDESGGAQTESATASDSQTSDSQDPTSQSDTKSSDSQSSDSQSSDSQSSDSQSSDSQSSDSATDTAGETGGPIDPPEGVVRFIAMGDGGEGNDHQFLVADIVEMVCADRGCDFVLYLGDNFYDVGVDSAMDQQFTDKFEMPYADLDLKFWITLGNHDYGTLANEWMKSQYQIEYSQYSDKWTLPSEYYTFDAEHVTFISLDTSRLFWDHESDAQAALVQSTLAKSAGRITVAFGHHPYLSNGKHGNAGNYEGIGFSPVDGEDVKEFFDEEICGKVTMYVCGHDHNLQWHPMPEHCQTEMIVSGAAAKTTSFEHRDDNPPVIYEDDQTPGFAWIEIADTTMTVAFYDEFGTKSHESSIELTP